MAVPAEEVVVLRGEAAGVVTVAVEVDWAEAMEEAVWRAGSAKGNV